MSELEKNTKNPVNTRPPVVTLMGHVDHGKTSILDFIRKSRVQAGEIGGITQHTSAYQVEHLGKKITFVDTPGHEAFTTMRMRGGQVADIVVLVVAANDGVKPQTQESISHIKLAGVPFIVAFNKTDLAEADVDKCRQQLAQEGVLTEKYGGDVVEVEVSAKSGKGIDSLLEMINLVAELQELKDTSSASFKGLVLEAHLDKGKGPSAIIIVKEGVLKVGDTVTAGKAHGKMKSLFDFTGKVIKEAYPSDPVELMGLSEVPKAGEIVTLSKDNFSSVSSESAESSDLGPQAFSFEVPAADIRILNLVVKTDTQGTLEAVRGSLSKVEDEKNQINIIHSGVGEIGESDILLAAAGRAFVVGFDVKVSSSLLNLALDNGVTVKTYRIIYELIDDVKNALQGVLTFEEASVKGRAEVIKIFKLPESGDIVLGCKVMLGKLKKGDRVKIFKAEDLNTSIAESRIEELHHLKDSIKEAPKGMECGVSLKPAFNEVEKGNILQVV